MIRIELHKALVNGVPEVGGRVYPLLMPQDTKENSIVYRIIGTNDITGVTCVNPVDTRCMVQIDVFAKTYAQSVEIMQKVKDVLRASFITFGINSYEDYANITVKYRQIIDVMLSEK